MKDKARKYQLIDYFDVWGNEKDGFEVNNQTIVEENIMISDSATNDEIIDYLIKIGYLKAAAKNEVELIDNFPYIEISAKNGFPLYCLQCLDD